MDIQKTLDELYGLSVFGIKLGLENINEILNRLGNPQDRYKTIHIAGTNGKGSTASMIECILLEKGYKVGKYTSPHIVKFNERIVFNREEISDRDIVKYYEIVREKMGDLPATFFEVTTAIMFLYFADKGIDYLVLEVGLGGRYDATNVVTPEMSLITSISMDHVSILGNTLYEIAREKAGIIKKDKKAFVIDTNDDVRKAVNETSGLVEFVKEKYNYEISLDKENLYTLVEVEDEIYKIPLFGKFQGDNFLLVYAAMKELGIDKKTIKNGLLNVKWPGRFEIFIRNPLVILDGAHNEDSSLKLVENLKSISNKEDVCFLTSILEDKDIGKILKNFSNVADKIVYTSLKDYHRGLGAKEMYDRDIYFDNRKYYENMVEAYNEAKKSKIVVVAGSFYLLCEFRRVIESENRL